mmetsp:Transcript_40782/g.36203  ORF Transcript_40782/g.36203 Transcript_40782/m.36203 type:complete len:91 (-) Transcript_40782:477-749(-)
MGDGQNSILESMFRLYKDTHLPNSHFSFLCSHGDFIDEYIKLFTKLSRFEVLEGIFLNQNFDKVMEGVIRKVLNTESNHLMIFISDEEMF